MPDAKKDKDSQSKMHRFMIGDNVTFDDTGEWPVVTLEGVIKNFDNDELTYINVDFGDGDVRTVTEDEVKRV